MAHLSQDQLRALDEAVKDGDEDRIFNACIAVGMLPYPVSMITVIVESIFFMS